MAEPSRSVQGLDKFWFARTALACVAAIAQRQGDAFGLLVCTDGRVDFTPASRGPRQLQRVLAALQRARPSGLLPDAGTLRASLHFARSQSMVFTATDALDWPSPLSEALIRLRHMRHDVRLLALRTEAEATAHLPTGHAYRDPEAPSSLHSFDRNSREAYGAALDGHFAAVRSAARQHDIPLCVARIEQPLGEVLRAWLRNPR
jgi:uncharacterized protein (DUF58 family)